MQPLPDAAASPLPESDAASSAQARLPRVAIDMRALVPPPTGIGVYTRSLALALAARGGMRYLGLAHRPPRGSGELRAGGIEVEPPDADPGAPSAPGAPGSAAAARLGPSGP